MGKVCSKCGNDKELEEFSRKSNNKCVSWCKQCVSEYQKKYNAKNRENIKNKQKKYQEANKDSILTQKREYGKVWYANPKNRHEKQVENKQYKLDNPDKVRKQGRRYQNDKRHTDDNFRLGCNLRNRLYDAMKHNTKSVSAVRDLGCSLEELRSYLEAKFHSNPDTGEVMMWDNWGYWGWHIDHVIPLAAFDLKNKEQCLLAVHYSNLQPMWRFQNQSKGGPRKMRKV